MSGFLPGPFGPPLVYRSISEWQQLARSGSLRPDDQLYDPVHRVWRHMEGFSFTGANVAGEMRVRQFSSWLPIGYQLTGNTPH